MLKRFLKEISPRTSEKKTAIVTASPRKSGRCSILAKELKKQIPKSFIIKIADYKISPCKSCLKCSGGSCSIKDGFQNFIKKITRAETLILISPVYFSSIPAQLKAVIDRSQFFWENRMKPAKGLSGRFVLIGDEKKNYLRCCSIPVRAFFNTLGIKYGGGFYLRSCEIDKKIL